MPIENEKNVKRISREDLKRAHPALAEAVIVLSDDMAALKESVESMEKKFDNLHKAITGDPEYKAKGIIDHGKETEERITRVEERAEKRDEALTKRIEKLEGTYKWLSGAAFIVGIVVTFVIDWIRTHFFK